MPTPTTLLETHAGSDPAAGLPDGTLLRRVQSSPNRESGTYQAVAGQIRL